MIITETAEALGIGRSIAQNRLQKVYAIINAETGEILFLAADPFASSNG